MHQTPWSVLGIEPTADERTIKRAYASLLKVTSPEKDPAGYMKLREAYESAKQHLEYLARVRELREAEESAATDTVPAPQEDPEPVVESPQRRAFAELHGLLAQGRRDAFLEKLAAIKADNTFATLDEQYFFTGEVARLIQEFKIDDVEWCGKVAGLLGAREHENIFDGDARYWHAYQTLLDCHSVLLAARAQTHLDQQAGESVAPGYLHVYHVLTSPFDAERLSALTRSQAYLRVAERILERAKSDSSIVIPAENREWWERTAMAGQHQPIAAPAGFTITEPVPIRNERKFPYWSIWVILFAIAQFARVCSSSYTPTSVPTERLPHVRSSEPLNVYQEGLRLRKELNAGSAEEILDRRLATCDEATRQAIRDRMYVAQANKRFEASSSATDKWLTPRPRGLSALDAAAEPPLDESDPALSALLDKCQTASIFEDPGKLIETPGRR